MRRKYWKCFDIKRDERGEWIVGDRSYDEMLNADYPILFHNRKTNELFDVYGDRNLLDLVNNVICSDPAIDKIYVLRYEKGEAVKPAIDVEFEEIVNDDMSDNDSALNEQIGGTHYKDVAIQPVEYIERNHLGFCAGNVVKYVTRHKQKGGKEDLLKARHYIDLLIEIEYGKD